MADIVLSDGQEKAADRFVQFLYDPNEPVFVLCGYSGTGKSTLIKHLMDNLPKYLQVQKMIDPQAKQYEIQLTATTNKAAETFSHITGLECLTIHSFLGLMPMKDYSTGRVELRQRNKGNKKYGYLLFVDEASMVDSKLLSLIFDCIEDCKIVFIGDPAQLPPVKSSTTPVFDAGFPTAMLTEVMRQAEGNPIIQLATNFRHTVTTGVWTPFEPDGVNVIHLPRDDFDEELLKEFSRPDWKYRDSKLLSFTNHRAIYYNQELRNHVKGDPELQVGDYAICNSYVQVHTDGKNGKIATDQLVYISDKMNEQTIHGVEGTWLQVDRQYDVFLPKRREDVKELTKWATKNNDQSVLRTIDRWIDLRAAYAQTVTKSQGSTYDTVFIDVDDISTCTIGNLIARMMYVGTSRARYKCVLTGDFG